MEHGRLGTLLRTNVLDSIHLHSASSRRPQSEAHLARILALALMTLWAPQASPAAQKAIAFSHVNLVPMTSETVLEDRAVLVRDGCIAEIAPAASVEIPRDAQVIDCHGAYLMPGLADMHTHLNDSLFPHPFFNLFLANGVTTIRDLAQGSPPSILRYRREITDGKRLGPTIYVANTYWGWEPDAVGLIMAQQPLGYDCAKINSYYSCGKFSAIMQQARRMQTYTLGHIPYAVGLDGVLAAGMNEVSHVDEVVLSEMIGLDRNRELKSDEWDTYMVECASAALLPHAGMSMAELRQAVGPKLEEIVGRLQGKDITFTTTLICDEDTVDKLLHPEKLPLAAHAAYVSPRFLADMADGKDKHMQMLPEAEWAGFAVFSNLGKLLAGEMKRHGVRLVLGTDVGPTYLSLAPGFCVHDELRILVENGFTPFEALATCTRAASEVCARMTGRDEFGTIEVGKRADLLLVDGDPLVDLACARKPLGVMAAGRWLPADTLAVLLQVKTENASDRLNAAFKSGGIEAALGEYHAMTDGNAHNKYYYSSATLNEAGYELLGLGMTGEAVRVFELNAAEYPADPNTYDSLAEGYMKRGDNQLAIQFYRKSLALEPRNTNAVEMLKRLGVE
jgi:hypothetical protein